MHPQHKTQMVPRQNAIDSPSSLNVNVALLLTAYVCYVLFIVPRKFQIP
jgi:hypothetical protein